jgi:hypothetical protein
VVTNRDTLELAIVAYDDNGRLRWATDKQIVGLLRGSLIKPELHCSLDDALYIDVAGNLLSYSRLYYDYLNALQRYESVHERHMVETPDTPFKRKAPTRPCWPNARDPNPHAFPVHRI